MKDLVTIAIPTYNRARFITEAIRSAQAQTYRNIEILVVDNCSTDNTRLIVESIKDKRLKYCRNPKNIGMKNNWNKCVQLAKGQFILILGDDDILYPDFVDETIKIYKNYPNLGFIFTHTNKVDVEGQYLMRWGYDFCKPGYIKGGDYLLDTIKYGCCLTNSSTMICHKRIYNSVGEYRQEFGANTFDFNMYLRIAEKYDVYFLDKTLTDYRIHPAQVSELHWRRKERPTGKISTYLEIIKAISFLLTHSDAAGDKYRFLSKRLYEIDKKLTELLLKFVPEL